MKKRISNARQGRAGIIAVAHACNQLDLIWRDLREEDVGVDGTIEIALGDFPTGKIVCAQVKSGLSYIRAETATSFKFYTAKDDLSYWRLLSIPLFLLVHHPVDDFVYWVDVDRHFQSNSDSTIEITYISFSKLNKLDHKFESYLHDRFDLVTYTDHRYAMLKDELSTLTHEDNSSGSVVKITALDLFVEGLWGLCSKLQFHLSLITDLIRKMIRDDDGHFVATYTFSRATLYPFFSRYFGILTRHNLANLDAADISESMYQKLEYPTFIASLTTNGRRFVDYLRRDGVPRVHDNQYMTLSRHPHVQIEAFSDFAFVEGESRFGWYTDVLAISFNAQLDYYEIEHWHRTSQIESPMKAASQNMFYFELCDYIENHFRNLPKENIVLRHRDLPLTPLICWLERWYGDPKPWPTSFVRGKAGTETMGFADELTAILSPAGVSTTREPVAPPFPSPNLINGEILIFS